MKYKAIRIATVLLHISSSLSKLYELASIGYDSNKKILVKVAHRFSYSICDNIKNGRAI